MINNREYEIYDKLDKSYGHQVNEEKKMGLNLTPLPTLWPKYSSSFSAFLE